ncbi:MAG: hypothetical protein ACRD8O_21410 [Bryobacteraceae bacterium]
MLFLTALFSTAGTCFGAVVDTNFDNLTDGTDAANSYAAQGVTFSNALVQTEGISLSPIFPPASAPNVAINDPGAIMEIDFTTPVNYFSA